MNKKHVLHGALLALSLGAAVALQGCNGGSADNTASGSSAGVGSGGSGYSTGTVTGFGSVVVDGVHIDDRNATADSEVSGGTTEPADVKLGQRVEVETSQDGVAKAIHVMAEVIGLVQSVDSAGQKLVVAGQTVLINSDANNGPVTVYDGYSALADIQLSDAVEVHGIPVADTAGAVQIQASRIEKKTALSFVRVSSKVSSLSAGSKTFMLGSLIVDYSTASIVPANRQLADGVRVVVFGPSVSGNTLSARYIRIAEPKAKGVVAEVGGVVSKYDNAAQTFEVNGVKVNAKNAAIVPANRTLANDAYVRVKGTYADTGELVASQVEIRRKADSDFITEVSLNGSITDYVSLSSFKVRGVPVDAGSATLSNCPATLSNGLYVETAGNVGKTGVVATKVSCKDAPEAASIEVRGVASAVDPTALKFTLTSGGKAFDVQWNSQTRFSGVAAATLNGAQVKVEGYLKSGILIAKKISK